MHGSRWCADAGNLFDVDRCQPQQWEYESPEEALTTAAERMITTDRGALRPLSAPRLVHTSLGSLLDFGAAMMTRQSYSMVVGFELYADAHGRIIAMDGDTVVAVCAPPVAPHPDDKGCQNCHSDRMARMAADGWVCPICGGSGLDPDGGIYE